MVWVYYGVSSKCIDLYPMSTESQGPEILEDLCSDQGAPIKLKNDHAQMEIGKVWTSICRKYNIAQCTTEAFMPWQNEAERYIQELKHMVNLIMDITGCPNHHWIMCSLYVAILLNHLAHPSLKISSTQLLMPGYIQEALTITGLAVGASDGFLSDNSANVFIGCEFMS
jgi:hypothetical protein